MEFLIFEGEEDAYWWILCVKNILEQEEHPKVAKVMMALEWWVWWSQRH